MYSIVLLCTLYIQLNIVVNFYNSVNIRRQKVRIF